MDNQWTEGEYTLEKIWELTKIVPYGGETIRDKLPVILARVRFGGTVIGEERFYPFGPTFSTEEEAYEEIDAWSRSRKLIHEISLGIKESSVTRIDD